MGQPLTAAVRFLSGEREPVRVATTGNITLSGLQVVDDVDLEVGDRVLVKDQADATENGIRLASEGEWFRAPDASYTRAIEEGVTVHVRDGTVNNGKDYRFTSVSPRIGTDPITLLWSGPQAAQAGAEAAQEAAEAAQAAAEAAANNQMVFDTKALAGSATIPAPVNALRLNGSAAEGDGLGGLYIDTDNGSADTFDSADGRTWYRVADVGEERLSDPVSAALRPTFQNGHRRKLKYQFPLCGGGWAAILAGGGYAYIYNQQMEEDEAAGEIWTVHMSSGGDGRQWVQVWDVSGEPDANGVIKATIKRYFAAGTGTGQFIALRYLLDGRRYLYVRNATDQIGVFDVTTLPANMATLTPVVTWDVPWSSHGSFKNNRLIVRQRYETKGVTQRDHIFVEYSDDQSISDEGYDIIIPAGQSNESGSTGEAVDAILDASDPLIDEIRWTAYGVYNQPQNAVEDLGWPEYGSTGIGPAMSFAKAYLPFLRNGRKVLILPCARGTSGLANPGDLWFPGVGDLAEYTVAVANHAVALNPGNRVVAVLWSQGENESEDGTAPATYAAKLDELIGNWRSRIATAENVPFIVMDMVPEWVAGTTARQNIRAQLEATPKRVARTAFVPSPTGYASADPIHFNAAGQRIRGRDAFSKGYLPLIRKATIDVGLVNVQNRTAGYEYAFPKQQSFADGGQFLVGGYGGAWLDTNPLVTPSMYNGMRAFAPTGEKLFEGLYRPDKIKALLTAAGRTVTRVENEGCTVTSDGRVLTGMITLGQADAAAFVDDGFLVFEEFSADADALDFSSAITASPSMDAVKASVMGLPRNADGMLYQPNTGKVITKLADLIGWMVAEEIPYYSFYSTNVPILDLNGAALPASTRVDLYNVNNNTLHMHYWRSVIQQMWTINVSLGTQTLVYPAWADGQFSLGPNGGFFNFGSPDNGTALVIASGAITVSQNHHIINSSSAANLETITGGVNGNLLVLRTSSNAAAITVKHGTGNIYLDGSADKSLNNSRDTLTLMRSQASWLQVGFSNNG